MLVGIGAGGKGDDRGWDGWMASLTQWTWVWVNSGSWWWTGRPGVLRFIGSQRVGHDWVTELNWKLAYNILLASGVMAIYFRIINQSRWCLSHFFVVKCAFGARRMGQIAESYVGKHTYQFYLSDSTGRPWLVETIKVVMMASYCPASLPWRTLVFTKVWI